MLTASGTRMRERCSSPVVRVWARDTRLISNIRINMSNTTAITGGPPVRIRLHRREHAGGRQHRVAHNVTLSGGLRRNRDSHAAPRTEALVVRRAGKEVPGRLEHRPPHAPWVEEARPRRAPVRQPSTLRFRELEVPDSVPSSRRSCCHYLRAEDARFNRSWGCVDEVRVRCS